MSEREELPEVERAVVYTPQAGDVVVIEIENTPFTRQHADQLKRSAEMAFGRDVKIVVLAGARFAGVVRG